MAKKAAKKEPTKVAAKKKEPVKKAAAPKAVEKETKEPAVKKEAPVKKTAKEKKEEAARIAADERWVELKEKHGKDKATKYSMTGQFAANTGIEHPKLGWGYILTNNNDRLEVVFQDGVRILISNYNSNQKI